MTKQECDNILAVICAASVSLQMTINSVIYDARIDLAENTNSINEVLSKINMKLVYMLTVSDLLHKLITDDNADETASTAADNAYLLLNTMCIELTEFIAMLITCSTDENVYVLFDSLVTDFNTAYNHVVSQIEDLVSFETKELVKHIDELSDGEDLV